MADKLQQHEEIARPIGERCAGQKVDRGISRGVGRRRDRAGTGVRLWTDLRNQLPRQLAASTGVILEVVRLVKNKPGPGHTGERVHVLRQQVVVDDHPLGLQRRLRAALRGNARALLRGNARALLNDLC